MFITISRRMFALVFGSLVAIGAQAQVTGTKNIPGDYADLAAAIADVNTNGVGAGGATLNLLATNPQTAPAGGYSISTTTSSAANPLRIVGNANTVTANAALTAGALNDAIFKVIGSDSVEISGFVMQENAANTTTTLASNNMTEWGVAILYASLSDNAQNVLLQGNTISLNRASNNTYGIYANATHAAATPTTTATATGATGGNNGLKIFGNTISNVNNGIVIVGPTAAADHTDGVEIGGSAANANTITNFGTGTAASTFASLTSSNISGVLIRNVKNFTVSNNTITSSNATAIPVATNSGTLRAVYVPAFNAAPLGTIGNSISNNTIEVVAGAATTTLQGIFVEATSCNATSSYTINDNDFNRVSFNINGTTVVTLVSQLCVALNSTINGNDFNNLSINNTLAVNFIAHGFTLPAGGTKTVNNNRIVTAFNKTVAGGTVTLYVDNASSPANTTSTNTGNDFSNITVTGATAIAGWANTDGGGVGTVTKTISYRR
jgi:trimeric autotransporter adhesin